MPETELTNQLETILPASRVLTGSIERVAYASDASYFRLVPRAVVQPANGDEVRALFHFSQEQHIPMTFRAAGTSLSGQAQSDGILVDISRHWRDYRVEAGGDLLRAEPGLIGTFLNNVLKPYGRRIGPDPASIDACMLGGILANNSGGMCCGVTENAYRTLHSMRFILPDGFSLDSAAPDAQARFEDEAGELASGLRDLKARLLADEELVDRVRRRYRMKNTNGYLLNAFLDFETPLDMLVHLLIGSEGTLGFIEEAVLHTLPMYKHKYTAQLYFRTVQDAADAIAPLRESGARAADIMDRAALRSVEDMPGVPTLLKELPEGAAAILVEYQAVDMEHMHALRQAAGRVCQEIRLLHLPEFTDDPERQVQMWKPRKGIIPAVGAMRPAGTTSLIEDVVFPVERLAEAITDLQALFNEHGYTEGVIFGHAKDGNLHFLINQSFNTQAEIDRFGNFSRDLVRLVSGKYDGALKTEHGTGRNMAPFVVTEWGATAYGIMCDLKDLLDPTGMLNPGVIIHPDPQAHLLDLKAIPPVGPEIDRCIECGFCESKCPSRELSLTPRQRIVVQREIARLRALDRRTRTAEETELLHSLEVGYGYAGVDTCAVDGMCATGCPVAVNTGDLTRKLRGERTTRVSGRLSRWAAGHFAILERLVRSSVTLAHTLDGRGGTRKGNGRNSLPLVVTRTVEVVSGLRLPKWNRHIPYPSGDLHGRCSIPGEPEYIYFPSCISRQLGVPVSGDGARGASLGETLLVIAGRAGVALAIPEEVHGTCCGLPFSSKGYSGAYRDMLHATLVKFWRWSQGGRLSIVIDTTSCSHSLRTCSSSLSAEDRSLWEKLTMLDSLEFVHDVLLPKLSLNQLDQEVVLHPNCSAQRLGLDEKMVTIARACARSVTVPLALNCCASAGDRGLLYPELTASATTHEAAEVRAQPYDGYFSSNIACEIGMSQAVGETYRGLVYLVEQASAPE